MSLHNRASPRAFTLVELLVVIGIIAVLIGVLLPVLAGVASRGRDLKCQANIRSQLQMILTYAAENKGSLPYGWYYNIGNSHTPPYDWERGPGSNGQLTTVFSIISRMSGKQYRGDDIFAADVPGSPEARANTAPFLRCPEAEQVLPHICSYVVQFVAFITPVYERVRVPHPGAIQDRPAKTRDLFPFTILVHDTAVVPGMIDDVGYVTDADVDAQRMWIGAATPQYRYYDFSDPFASLPPGAFGNNKPVAMGTNWKNIDPPATRADGFNTFPYQGNLRFRHNKNTSINVGYADGRVESSPAKFNPSKSMRSHAVLRKSFMIKWPAGLGIARDDMAP
jgi:prepilin-type N-terminal cleavage/methylation domain-containing protein/prepilin-type processing-associated H-X9-DG protein